ncbi:MAG: HU family DNA-binding protein [Pseudonocardia sp.]
MNKSQLVDALAARIGDRRTAATAVDRLLETIVDTVGAGESVTLTGFGVFESRARAARPARNPRTGETVEVPATNVPAFRPGVAFRRAVGGTGALRVTSVPRPHPVVATAPAESAPVPAGAAVRVVAGPEAVAAEPEAQAQVAEPEVALKSATWPRPKALLVTVPAEGPRPESSRPVESTAADSNRKTAEAKVSAPFAVKAPAAKPAKAVKPAAKPAKGAKPGKGKKAKSKK